MKISNALVRIAALAVLFTKGTTIKSQEFSATHATVDILPTPSPSLGTTIEFSAMHATVDFLPTPLPSLSSPPPIASSSLLRPDDFVTFAQMFVTTEHTKNADIATITTTTTMCMTHWYTSTTLVLASVITAITTALLATLIFVLLQIALCKYHPKFKPRKSESAASAGGEELAVYEQVDRDERGVAENDNPYAEVDFQQRTIRGGGDFKLKENEAYEKFT